MIVGAHGTFENPDIPSFYILLKEENMLYKHVNNDMINLNQEIKCNFPQVGGNL